MIEAIGIEVVRGSRAVLALDSWQVAAGSASCVIGSSGSGKSTLLGLLGAMLKPTKGSLRIGGTDLSIFSEQRADAWRSTSVGIVPQSPILCEAINVLDNVLLSSIVGRGRATRSYAESLLRKTGIDDLALRKPSMLSYGQKQRVAIARALANQPSLILADEPTANLDATSCDWVMTLLLEEVAQRGATLVVTTHDPRVLSRFHDTLVLEQPVHGLSEGAQ